MKFIEFAQFLEKIETTSGRNEITVQIAEFIPKIDKDEIDQFFNLVQGQLYPKYESLEFNIARKLIVQALEKSVEDSQIVKQKFAEFGDVGKLAEYLVVNNLLGTQNNFENLEKVKLQTISEIHSYLVDLAKLGGKGSQDLKKDRYLYILQNIDPVSARYISRMIVGELRLGVSDKTILDSLSWYKVGDKSIRKNLDAAYGAKADLASIASILIYSPNYIEELENIKIEIGVPVASKLVEREKSPEKVWERMPKCFVQPKLDGLRGQIHFDSDKGISEIFSRNMENMTDQFPEIINAVANLGVRSIVLDSEIIGYDSEQDMYLSYQATMQRKRKYDIDKYAGDFPVRAMCFDILFLDGEDITSKPIEYRIEKLKKVLSASETLKMLETLQMQTQQELTDYFEMNVADGLEGIITKEVESTYEPGTRNFTWIKLKANSKKEMVDTIDVAVIGYYSGRGQRAKFGIGALLTAVYNPSEDTYYSIGKVGSGIKDADFEKIISDIKDLKISDKPENYIVEKQLYPDVWLDSKIVIEIDADEITRSPSHTAARGIETKVPKDKPEKGLSIRFPRLKVWNRDKNYPNTVEEIVRMYELRKGV